MSKENPNILIVDDDEELLENFSEYFSMTGYNVVTANRGIIAIQKSQNQMFDVILMDINMPSLKGDEAIVAIKNSKANIDTAVIAVSAHLDLETIRKLKGNVIKGFTKPVNLQELSTFIKKEILDV